MATDYIPRSYANLEQWLQNQKDNIAEVGTVLGMSADEQAVYLASVQRLLDKVTPIVDLTYQLDHLKADFEPLLASELPNLHQQVKRLKTHSGYAPSMGLRMGWVSERHEVDPSTSQPSITATAMGMRVKIEGNKPGFEAVNVYMRHKGGPDWTQIALRKRRFPIYDETPPVNVDVPEIREYLCKGVVDDEEIGLPSLVVEALVAK